MLPFSEHHSFDQSGVICSDVDSVKTEVEHSIVSRDSPILCNAAWCCATVANQKVASQTMLRFWQAAASKLFHDLWMLHSICPAQSLYICTPNTNKTKGLINILYLIRLLLLSLMMTTTIHLSCLKKLCAILSFIHPFFYMITILSFIPIPSSIWSPTHPQWIPVDSSYCYEYPGIISTVYCLVDVARVISVNLEIVCKCACGNVVNMTTWLYQLNQSMMGTKGEKGIKEQKGGYG